jgi:hypothetical protein
VVQTPSGGRHYYYVTDTPVGNSAQKVGEGVDIRGDGGFVVAPGSVLDPKLPENKGVGGFYTVLTDLPVIPVPEFIKVAAGKKREKSTNTLSDTEMDSPYDISSARAWLESHEPAVEGDGGDAHTFQTAAILRQRGLSEDTALALMLDHWNERCSPPWEYDELAKKVENAYRFASGVAGELSVAAVFEELAEIRPPQFYDANWFFHGDPLDTNESWLFHNILPAYGVGFLSGPSYSGKSFLMLDIARALSTGELFFETPPDDRGGTIIVAGEGKSGMRRRLAALGHEDRKLAIGGRSANGLYEDDVFHELVKDLANKMKVMRDFYEMPVRLIVFDTLSSTGLVEDENDNSEISRALAKLNMISEKLNVLVMITHHPAANGKSERGATAIFNNADFILRIERDTPDAPVRALELAKLKEGDAPRNIGYFELPKIFLGKDSRQREVVSCYVRTTVEPEKTSGPPKGYDNWLLTVSYLSQVSVVESDLGQKMVNPALLQETVTSEGMTKKVHGDCMAYAIAIGVIKKQQYDGKIWIVYNGDQHG